MDTDLKLHIAMQCAPVLLGLKMSNILITHPGNGPLVFQAFEDSGLLAAPLVCQRERSSFLIYRRSWLEGYVNRKPVAAFLDGLGYGGLSLEGQLRRMAAAYKGYMLKSREFPHEMGIFLGYPLKDVEGFMIHKGKNYLYSGYWKVYHNVEQAKAVFKSYDMAKKRLCYMAEKEIFMGRREDLKWIESM